MDGNILEAFDISSRELLDDYIISKNEVQLDSVKYKEGYFKQKIYNYIKNYKIKHSKNSKKLQGKSFDDLINEVFNYIKNEKILIPCTVKNTQKELKIIYDLFGDRSRTGFYPFEKSLYDYEGVKKLNIKKDRYYPPYVLNSSKTYTPLYNSTDNPNYTVNFSNIYEDNGYFSGYAIRPEKPYQGIYSPYPAKAVTFYFKNYKFNGKRNYFVDFRDSGLRAAFAIDKNNVAMINNVKVIINGIEYKNKDTIKLNDENFVYVECLIGTPSKFTIGNFYTLSDGGGSNYYINANIDNLSLWNRALTDTEIAKVQYERFNTFDGMNKKDPFQDFSVLAYYTFENNTLDSSAKQNNAEWVGKGYYRQGLFSNASFYDGTNYVKTPIKRLDEFTVSMWVNFDFSKTQNNWDTIFRLDGLQVGTYNSNGNKIAVWWKNNNTGYKKISETILESNRWYMLTFTYKNGTFNYYLNGNNVLNSSNVKFDDINDYPYFSIGRWEENNQSHHGLIDTTYIFNRELSEKEIKYLYNNSFDNVDILKDGSEIVYLPLNSSSIDVYGAPITEYNKPIDFSNGYALFDGSNAIRIDKTFSGIKSATVAFLFRSDLTNTSEQNITNLGTNTLEFRVLNRRINYATGDNWSWRDTNYDITSGWHTLILSYNAKNGHTKVYIDGVKKIDNNQGTSTHDLNYIGIAARFDNSNHKGELFTKGAYKEYKILNKEITDEEANTIHNFLKSKI